MKSSTAIILFICLMTFVGNYYMHISIIENSKDVRESAYEYVEEKCKCSTDNDYPFNLQTWNTTNPK